MKYQSDLTAVVCQAIEDARLEFLPLEKSGVNNYFKNKKGDPHLYSTLEDIFNACLPALHKHKLSIMYQVQIFRTDTSLENVLTTTITHLPSMQFISSATTLGNQTAKSQDVGSAITYLRRYQIQAMLNLEADFEDDGNAASGRIGGDANIVQNKTKSKTEMPKREYVLFDAKGKIASKVNSFLTYIKTLNEHNMKKHHEWASITIIQLQDMISWAEDLPKEHSKNAEAMITKCNNLIKFIKGE